MRFLSGKVAAAALSAAALTGGHQATEFAHETCPSSSFTECLIQLDQSDQLSGATQRYYKVGGETGGDDATGGPDLRRLLEASIVLGGLGIGITIGAIRGYENLVEAPLSKQQKITAV